MNDDLKAQLQHAAWCGDILVDSLCKEASDRIAELEAQLESQRRSTNHNANVADSNRRRAEAAEAAYSQILTAFNDLAYGRANTNEATAHVQAILAADQQGSLVDQDKHSHRHGKVSDADQQGEQDRAQLYPTWTTWWSEMQRIFTLCGYGDNQDGADWRHHYEDGRTPAQAIKDDLSNA